MSAADAVDAEVRFYDLDPETLRPDLDSVRNALTHGLHAVVIAHWFGLPVDLTEVRDLAGATGTRVIDDAAQGAGASVRRRPAGSLGDFGILSFGRGKGRTGGGGGALLATTADAASRLLAIAPRIAPAGSGLLGLVGLTALWALGRPSVYWIPAGLPWLHLGETVYRPAPALRGMPVPSATVVEAMWRESADEVAARRSHAARWELELTGLGGVTPFPPAPSSAAGWLRFPVRARGSGYAALTTAAARRLGVAPGYPTGLSELPVALGRVHQPGEYPGSATLSRSLLTLPTHGLVSASDFSNLRQLVQAS
jgi:dTDP-4-amino-4,6-dideoxygalactose transaminase